MKMALWLEDLVLPEHSMGCKDVRQAWADLRGSNTRRGSQALGGFPPIREEVGGQPFPGQWGVQAQECF